MCFKRIGGHKLSSISRDKPTKEILGLRGDWGYVWGSVTTIAESSGYK